MRKKATSGPLSAHAISGAHVVLLGIDMEEGAAEGLLGFAVEREDLTEDERYWLYGFKTFGGADVAPGAPVSTLEHPLQTFLWGDYSAKPAHSYRYRVVAMRGGPGDLRQGESVEVEVETEEPDVGAHEVHFNRGAAGSQAYARKFGDRPPHEVPGGEAWAWLSRGLEAALLAFLGRARGERHALRAAVYEFQYPGALAALWEAAMSGADVRVVFDAKENSQDYPNAENRRAIEGAGIEDLCVPRAATKSYIAHNKFVVLLEDGEPIEVWTGSTNLTGGGIFGHSNVGHVVRDRAVAERYLSYWQELSGDPDAKDLRPWTEEHSPVPEEFPPGTTAVFSPRASLAALERYAGLMGAAGSAVFLTAAFGVNDLLEGAIGREAEHLRYVLLEKEDEDMEVMGRDPDNRFAVGGTIGSTTLGSRLREERLTGLNAHVKYVHTKYALIDPLGDDPVVITGSANFSDASTKNNDENMLVIRGDAGVASPRPTARTS